MLNSEHQNKQFRRKAQFEASKSVVIRNQGGGAGHVKQNYIVKSIDSCSNVVERDYEALRKTLNADEDIPKDIERKMRIPPTDTHLIDNITNLFPTIEMLREIMKVVPMLRLSLIHI